jgi:hypothetical protein
MANVNHHEINDLGIIIKIICILKLKEMIMTKMKLYS